ncbi:uncharacterized protein LOC122010602 [Zingiber officinale]|uniref:uncharacterized protein LOC122010602 n=1 Tax=Zingiber officinale TaxID=94328 RepID=UPI001C4C8860|nr:uncharacterized protein LOC122010602 [Zingiber officinale]
MHSPFSEEVDQPPSQTRIDQLTLQLAEKERELERVSKDRARQLAALRSMEAQYRVAKSCVHAEKARKEECQARLQRQLNLQERLKQEHETELSLLRAYLDDKQDTIARQQTVINSLHAQLARALNAPGAPESPDISSHVAAILRSFANQEIPSVAVLQALNEELTQGLSSAPAASAGPQPSGPQPSETVVASAFIEPPAPSPADSVIPRISDQPAPESSPAGQVPSLPPTMKLRLTRKGKRTAPVTATSPPPPRRQRVVSISSPSRSSDTSSTQETSLAREKASDLEVADPSLDLTALVPIQGVSLPLPSSSGDQPLGLLTPPASPLLAPMSSAMPTLNLPPADLAFEASWRLPSEIDPSHAPAADLSSIFSRVDFYGDLATAWQSANRQFWESSSPLEGFDQIARSLVARAAELQRENALLKARLQELEPPAASSAPPEPSLGSLDAYLRAVGESAASARAISHAAFDKLQKLEAALKTSESSLASEADRHQATVSELKDKEAELLSRSADLSSLRQSQELLQMGLADAQALASAAASREATMRTQWEACQATLQSLQAELSKAQEAVSQGQSDLSVARAEVAENKNSLEAYRSGESERLKAYRLAYVRSSFFLQKLGRWMVLLLCHGAASGVRQAFEQGFLRSAPPATFLDTARLSRELPQETFPSFEADDGLFLLEAPPPAADLAPVDISAQALPAAAPETSADPASSAIVLADPMLLPLAYIDPAPSSSDVV